MELLLQDSSDDESKAKELLIVDSSDDEHRPGKYGIEFADDSKKHGSKTKMQNKSSYDASKCLPGQDV